VRPWPDVQVEKKQQKRERGEKMFGRNRIRHIENPAPIFNKKTLVANGVDVIEPLKGNQLLRPS